MPRTYLSGSDPALDAALSGEQALVVAVLTQALHNARDPDADIRAEARRFATCGGPDWWANLLGLGDAVIARLRQEMARRQELMRRQDGPSPPRRPRRSPNRHGI